MDSWRRGDLQRATCKSQVRINLWISQGSPNPLQSLKLFQKSRGELPIIVYYAAHHIPTPIHKQPKAHRDRKNAPDNLTNKSTLRRFYVRLDAAEILLDLTGKVMRVMPGRRRRLEAERRLTKNLRPNIHLPT